MDSHFKKFLRHIRIKNNQIEKDFPVIKRTFTEVVKKVRDRASIIDFFQKQSNLVNLNPRRIPS